MKICNIWLSFTRLALFSIFNSSENSKYFRRNYVFEYNWNRMHRGKYLKFTKSISNDSKSLTFFV